MPQKELTKPERLGIIYERLTLAAPASNHEEAFQLIDRIVTEVENEFSGIPADPLGSGTDGRIYPPSKRYVHLVEGRPGVTGYRLKRHDALIGVNGSIEFRTVPSDEVVLEKSGQDGRFARSL